MVLVLNKIIPLSLVTINLNHFAFFEWSQSLLQGESTTKAASCLLSLRLFVFELEKNKNGIKEAW
jgi:hypothetical protein